MDNNFLVCISPNGLQWTHMRFKDEALALNAAREAAPGAAVRVWRDLKPVGHTLVWSSDDVEA